MSNPRDFENPGRVLVVIPNWVGDVVLATPVLAALRAQFPAAHLAFLCRSYVADVLAGCPWYDQLLHWPARRGWNRELNWLRFAHRLRTDPWDLAILLTNSFRSGLAVWLGGVRRRVGFARDGRSCLLTDRLTPSKTDGRFVPTPVLESYTALARHVGATISDTRLRLGITASQEAAAADLRTAHGLAPDEPYAVINPGAAFGAAKCWLPERFAEVCDQLEERFGLRPVIVGAPGEADLMQTIANATTGRTICCTNPGTTLGSLKPIIRDARLLVCNDTGPRHYGSAFNVPTVTIFGPTHQAWTDTPYDREIKLQADVPCGPCQLRKCPLDHRCMHDVTIEMVLAAAAEILAREPRHSRPLPVQPPGPIAERQAS